MSTVPFIKYGSGPLTVVLMHGFCEDRRIFDGIIPYLDQKNYSWFLPDLPGFGDAAKTGLLEHSITGYADYIRDWILDQSKGTVILAGHSMGGYVALDFAAHYPEQLRGLVLIHSQASADSADKKRSRNEHIQFLEKNGMAKYAARLIPLLYHPKFREEHKDIITGWIEKASKYNSKGVSLALQSMRDRKDHTSTLRSLKFPVGIIAGDLDPVIPIEVSLKESHLASTSSFHLLEQVGHMGMVEAPELLGTTLQKCVDALTQVAV